MIDPPCRAAQPPLKGPAIFADVVQFSGQICLLLSAERTGEFLGAFCGARQVFPYRLYPRAVLRNMCQPGFFPIIHTPHCFRIKLVNLYDIVVILLYNGM